MEQKKLENVVTREVWHQWFDKNWYELLEDYEHTDPDRVKRLYSCSAQTMEYFHVIVLQSYSTIVAVYDKHPGDLFVNGHYSATTDQHVCKFKRYIRSLRYELNHEFNRSENSRGIVGYNYEYTVGYYRLYKREGVVLVANSGHRYHLSSKVLLG